MHQAIAIERQDAEYWVRLDSKRGLEAQQWPAVVTWASHELQQHMTGVWTSLRAGQHRDRQRHYEMAKWHCTGYAAFLPQRLVDMSSWSMSVEPDELMIQESKIQEFAGLGFARLESWEGAKRHLVVE